MDIEVWFDLAEEASKNDPEAVKKMVEAYERLMESYGEEGEDGN